jgi:hypothetical protein
MEIAFWNAVKDSKNPIVLSTYLDRFPNGTFAGLARVLVEQIKQEQTARENVAERQQGLSKAEEAKKAEAKRRDELGNADEAIRLQELNAARQEAREAQEAVKKKAEADRLAALKPAEDPRKSTQEAQAKLAPESSKTAALATGGGPKAPDASPSDPAALVRAVQTELKRVGCYSGSIDGQWDSRARDALAEFTRITKSAIATDEPTSAGLEAIAGQKSRICPLRCGSGEIEMNGRCVAKAEPSKQITSKREGKNSGARSSAKQARVPATKSENPSDDRINCFLHAGPKPRC